MSNLRSRNGHRQILKFHVTLNSGKWNLVTVQRHTNH